MGQGQSSGSASKEEVPIHTSYYELLGVERTASDDEIKKAYRRKALELHPDRNFGKEDEATKLFSEISAAYEVLSDPQERAWYDGHESEILRGGDGGSGEGHFEGSIRVTTAEDVVGMIGKFNGRVKFDNSPEGFFGFLRDAFERLAKEEEVAASNEGVYIHAYPSFGHQEDKHEDVVQDFYKGWAGFSTHKSFAWKDKWRLTDAPDRRIKRLMEKENKKLREEGIREFNDAVRALVAFVRKRDPRYTPSTQTEAERQKALREASAAQAARARAANAAKMDDVVPEWTKSRDPEDEIEISESESEEEHFECVACHKTFKSERQFEAHERSKKHQKAIFNLKKQMRKDNARLNLDDDVESSGVITPQEADDEDASAEEQDLPEKVEKLDLSEEDLDEEGSSDADEKPLEKQPPPKSAEATDEDDDEDSDYAPRSKVQSRINGSLSDDKDNKDILVNDAAETSSTILQPPGFEEEPSGPAPKKLGKAAQKRAKKAAKAAEVEAVDEENKFKCAKCNASFPSKTRLFQHIKDFGHAALKTEVGKGKKGKR